MEFWEGAILVVGGVWLVKHMANRHRSALANVSAQSSLGSAGTSNASNLTNITNTAGGYPTIAGEPLDSPQPPIMVPIVKPAQPIAIRPVAMPKAVTVNSKVVPFSRPVAPVAPVRVNHLMLL